MGIQWDTTHNHAGRKFHPRRHQQLILAAKNKSELVMSSEATTIQAIGPVRSRRFALNLIANVGNLGLSMAVAQQILRRHYGEIVFRKEDSNRGVFSLLIHAPESKKN